MNRAYHIHSKLGWNFFFFFSIGQNPIRNSQTEQGRVIRLKASAEKGLECSLQREQVSVYRQLIAMCPSKSQPHCKTATCLLPTITLYKVLFGNQKLRSRLIWWLSGKKKFACHCRRHGFDPWSRKIPQAMEQLSLCTTTTRPVLCRLVVATAEPTSQSLCSATREATTVSSPRTTTKSRPHSQQLEKIPNSNKDPAQPK